MKGFRYLAREKISKVPKAPGVYALASPKETLYIGKAANLQERIKNHFQKSSYRDNLFVDKVTRVGWIETQSDIDALLLESQLIKQKKPKYNVMWTDDKGYFYVGITPSTMLRTSKEQFPRVFLTHQPFDFAERRRRTLSDEQSEESKGLRSAPLRASPKNVNYIGPFVDGKAIKQVLRLLRRVFPYYVSKTHPAGSCPWCHLGLCPGPNPNPKEYRRNIKNLEAVLHGKKTSVWKNLNKAMGEAAKLQKYEEAAKLRDQIGAFKRVFMHSVVEFMLQQDYYDSYQRGEKQLRALLNLKKPVTRIEAYDISNIQGKFATGSMVTFLKGKPAKEWYRKFKIHPVIRQGTPSNDGAYPNDFAMMQELVSRRLKHAEWPYPDLMLIDGGKPQLSAALKALEGYKILNTKYKPSPRAQAEGIQVAALAKKHNELFFPGRSQPLLLKNLPQEVSNLLLYIRDEAHRFAITYHRKLRRIDAFSEK